jgi:hypothetical protein
MAWGYLLIANAKKLQLEVGKNATLILFLFFRKDPNPLVIMHLRDIALRP